MIRDVIEILQSRDWEGQDEVIEIAKGKYEYTNTLMSKLKKIKRIIKLRNKR